MAGSIQQILSDINLGDIRAAHACMTALDERGKASLIATAEFQAGVGGNIADLLKSGDRKEAGRLASDPVLSPHERTIQAAIRANLVELLKDGEINNFHRACSSADTELLKPSEGTVHEAVKEAVTALLESERIDDAGAMVRMFNLSAEALQEAIRAGLTTILVRGDVRAAIKLANDPVLKPNDETTNIIQAPLRAAINLLLGSNEPDQIEVACALANTPGLRPSGETIENVQSAVLAALSKLLASGEARKTELGYALANDPVLKPSDALIGKVQEDVKAGLTKLLEAGSALTISAALRVAKYSRLKPNEETVGEIRGAVASGLQASLVGGDIRIGRALATDPVIKLEPETINSVVQNSLTQLLKKGDFEFAGKIAHDPVLMPSSEIVQLAIRSALNQLLTIGSNTEGSDTEKYRERICRDINRACDIANNKLLPPSKSTIEDSRGDVEEGITDLLMAMVDDRYNDQEENDTQLDRVNAVRRLANDPVLKPSDQTIVELQDTVGDAILALLGEDDCPSDFFSTALSLAKDNRLAKTETIKGAAFQGQIELRLVKWLTFNHGDGFSHVDSAIKLANSMLVSESTRKEEAVLEAARATHAALLDGLGPNDEDYQAVKLSECFGL